jgi:hypothetical protein
MASDDDGSRMEQQLDGWHAPTAYAERERA